MQLFVIPAQAGIHQVTEKMGSRLRESDRVNLDREKGSRGRTDSKERRVSEDVF